MRKIALPPPAVADSERCLLHLLLRDPESVPAIRETVPVHALSESRHQVIYQAIVGVREQIATYDRKVVESALRQTGSLDFIGGSGYLDELHANWFSTHATLPYHCKRILDAWYRRRLIDLCQNVSDQAADLTQNEVQDLASDLAAQLGRIAAQNAPGSISTLRTGLGSLIDTIEQGRPTSISTGVRSFDAEFGGLPRQGVVIVLGVNGSGKSSLVNNWVCELALRHGLSGRVCSYEMGAAAVGCMASSETGVRVMEHMRNGSVPSPDEFRRLMEFQARDGTDKVVFEGKALTASELYNVSAVDVSRGHSFLVLDYIQSVTRRPGQEEADAIRETAQTLQRISKEFGLLVIAVSQMTLQAKRAAGPPQANDGIGGAAIGEVADMTIGVYRPCLWERPDAFDGSDWNERKRQAELHVVKNKFGGLGIAHVEFDGPTFKFRDRPRDAWANGGGGWNRD